MGNSQPAGVLGKKSTALEATGKERLDKKVVIVTGANTGIGKETARAFAHMGGHVILACRDMTKCKAAVDDIKGTSKNDNVEGMHLDLSSLKSIKQFVADFKEKDLPLHLLVNNAGIMAPSERMETKDGFEIQIGTNHIGHFYLTKLLLPCIKKAGEGARIVVLSSVAHKDGKINFDDINLEKSYHPWIGYRQSKAANVLFSNELNRRLSKYGITSNSVHPGVINSELARNNWWAQKFYNFSDALGFLKSNEQGASTTVYVAVSPDLKGVGGKYFADCHEAKTDPYVEDAELAKKFWKFTKKLIDDKLMSMQKGKSGETEK